MDASLHPLSITRSFSGPVYRIFLKDFVADFAIGVHPHERGQRQRLRINLGLTVRHPGPGFADDIGAVMSYESLVFRLRALAERDHVELLETLAERIADFCFSDVRVLTAQVTVEKLDLFPELASVGVVIDRRRADLDSNQATGTVDQGENRCRDENS